ncbi:hypothetical protein [Agrococcus sp. DT81.2]|uniref:hypothetical protein n=1 Tax=Agrococcus sp. DT81.2 TaxID=3393414 RepID=UPI003CE4D867
MTEQNVEETLDALEASESDEQNESVEAAPQEGAVFDADQAREKIRKLNSEARNLRERAKKADEAEKAAGESGKRVTDLEAENLRLKVAIRASLPPELAERLRGSTEEELLEDADKLLTLVTSKRPPSQQPREQLRGGGDPTVPVEEADLDKLAERMFRK